MESKAVVSLTNGKKAFGNNEVLKDISLTVNAGDVLAIIGPSGGGKATLLRCMTLLETLDSGDLSYGDLTVCANDAAGRAVYGGKDVIAAAKTRFGLVFQNFNLFPHYTVLQNVTDALICVQKMPKDEAESKAIELLKKVGLADRVSAYPRYNIHIVRQSVIGSLINNKGRIPVAGISADDPGSDLIIISVFLIQLQ